MPIIQTTKELRPRDERDHYPTPRELCEAAVNTIPELETAMPLVLDPGAGEGPWGKAVRKRWVDAEITGVEMNKSQMSSRAYDQWYVENYLEFDFPRLYRGLDVYRPYDLIIGNPPYGRHADGTRDRNLAEKFVRKSFELVMPGGYIVFLLRLAFLEGQRRSVHFWPKYPLKDIYVLSRRPSFTGNQRTDATAYGLFVWQKGYDGPTYLKRLVWDYEDEIR